MNRILRRQQLVPRARPEVFSFFSDAHNLERLTPSSLRFKILTPNPIAMREGTLIDYELRLSGIPLRWETEIERWEPDVAFVDVQRRGPYKHWRHTHTFSEAPLGTLVADEVEYALPFGVLGDLVHVAIVARQLDEIFSYRAKVIEEIFQDRS